MLKRDGINLYLDNMCLLIKFDQLKMLAALNLSFFLMALHLLPLAQYQP